MHLLRQQGRRTVQNSDPPALHPEMQREKAVRWLPEKELQILPEE